MDEPVETLQQTHDLVTRLAIEFGPRLLSAALVLVVGLFVTSWVGRLTAKGLERFAFEPPVHQLVVRVVRLLVFLLFVLMALQNLGIELLPLIAGLGIAGAGVALALQGVLGNVAAGLTIIFTRPFRVSEYISIAGEEGEVQSISLFNTTLRHTDLSLVVIPNRKIAGEILHNYGAIRQLNVSVGVAYDTNIEDAIATIREVLASNPRVLTDPAPVVQAAALGTFAINFAVKPWVNVPDFEAATGETNAAIVREFRSRGVVIPSLPAGAMLTQTR